MDTHTAVAASVYHKYREETSDKTKTVIVSTASPYKFTQSVLEAVSSGPIPENDYDQAKKLKELSGVAIPNAVTELQQAPILHNTVCETVEMQAMVEKYLKIN